MRPFFTTILLILTIVSSVSAQTLSREYGVVGKDDFDYVYDEDPEASAVILFDIGYALFAPLTRGDGIVFTRTKRIKVLSQSGINYANFEIPYYVDGFDRTMYINKIEAITYNFEDGRLTRQELDPATIYDEKRNENWHVKKIPMPNVKQGSIIEISYELHSPFLFKLPNWQFQDDIPTLYSEYKVRMSPRFDYIYIAQGFSKFTRHDVEENNLLSRTKVGMHQSAKYSSIQTFVMEDIPAFKDESYISSKDDYIMKIDFQVAQFMNGAGALQEVMSTWPTLNSQMLKEEMFGKYIKRSRNLVLPILDQLPLNGLDPLAKAKRIIRYVKQNFTWDGYQSVFASQTPKKFFEERRGNSADINLLLIALLQEAGIEVDPVILSTRDHGKVRPDYAFLHYFNYVVPLVKLENTSFLTDGTEHDLAYNRIPPRCINDMGLQVIKNNKRWVSLYNEYPSTFNVNINITPKPETDVANVTAVSQSMEYSSYMMRSTYSNNEGKIKNEFKQYGFDRIDEVRVLNEDNPTKPYVLSLKGEAPLTEGSNMMFIKPLLAFPLGENLLKQSMRTYPVDFTYRTTNSYTSYVAVPAGYEVLSMPQNFTIDDNILRFKIESSVSDGQISVKAEYEFKKAVYMPNQYELLKADMDQLIKHINEEVILQKKSE